MPTIAILGASTYWSPMVCTNLMSRFAEPIEFRLIDIDPRNLDLVSQWGAAANRRFGRADAYPTFRNRAEGLQGAQAVIVTISTGGLDAMRADMNIPEKYGIFATVGDTAGPAGWSRSIRNIPVFMAFAHDFDTYCPRALIANYTNPMSSLTATIQRCCGNPTVGLCHSYLQTIERIRLMFGLEDARGIAVQIAGMNHFHWVVRFTVGGRDGYAMLRERIGKGSIADLMPKNDLDAQGKVSIYFGSGLMEQLYETYGHLAYCGDRHTAEFLPFTVSGFPARYKKDNNKGAQYDTITYGNIYRTTHADRMAHFAGREQRILAMVDGKADMRKMPGEAETAEEAGIIRAYLTNKPFMDGINHLNVGQIPQLPTGACVETLGTIDGLGVHPCVVPDIPAYLVEIMRPQADSQIWLVEGVMQRDKNLLLQALYRDPQCTGMKPHDIRAMADELLAANRDYVSV